MAENYKQERIRQARISKAIGISLAAGLHVGLVVFGCFSGLQYLYPPPPEQTPVLIDFSEAEYSKPVQQKRGTEPKSAEPQPEKKIDLIQKSEAQMEGTKANEAPEATVGEDGDVEVPEPPRKKEINRRALFHAAENNTKKDTLAPQTSDEISEKLKTGHSQGNTVTGKTDGTPTAKVKGRSTVGNIPLPSYPVQEDGTVVVDILVDQNGKVISATPGGQGTTVTDKQLWTAARNAAMNTHFNTSYNAPVQQPGTITYIFKLNK